MNRDPYAPRPPTLEGTAPFPRFAVVPDPVAPFPWTVETELERLKNRLLREVLAASATPSLVPTLRRAANEAAALAWLEPHPLLVFPVLFEEKTKAARQHNHRQGVIRSRTAELLAEAA